MLKTHVWYSAWCCCGSCEHNKQLANARALSRRGQERKQGSGEHTCRLCNRQETVRDAALGRYGRAGLRHGASLDTSKAAADSRRHPAHSEFPCHVGSTAESRPAAVISTIPLTDKEVLRCWALLPLFTPEKEMTGEIPKAQNLLFFQSLDGTVNRSDVCQSQTCTVNKISSTTLQCDAWNGLRTIG